MKRILLVLLCIAGPANAIPVHVEVTGTQILPGPSLGPESYLSFNVDSATAFFTEYSVYPNTADINTYRLSVLFSDISLRFGDQTILDGASTRGVFGGKALAPGTLETFYFFNVNGFLVDLNTGFEQVGPAYLFSTPESLMNLSLFNAPPRLATWGDYSVNIKPWTVEKVTVPEPGTLGLFIVGGAASMLARRRKAKPLER